MLSGMALHEMHGCGETCEGTHAELIGGPLDGHLVPVDGWSAERRMTGVAHIVPGEDYRACYSAPADDPMAAKWEFEGCIG